MCKFQNIEIQLCVILLHLSLYSLKLCSYKEKCNLGLFDKINVHIISHTHDDAGWLKNVDDYYIGSDKQNDRSGVQYILNSVLKNLDQNSSRKFAYVEGAYMHRWLSENNHYQLDKLINNGQMEVLSGGWVMNDEACTHYNDIINQMTLGFEIYKIAFKDCGIPRTGWQIDPFGHSAAQADLFAQMGFDGMFFGRVSDKLKIYRSQRKMLEFVWEPMPNFYDIYSNNYFNNLSDPDFYKIHRRNAQLSPNLFIGILPNLYQPPPGFCFDILCNDDPIQDDPNLSGYNKDDKIDKFIEMMEEQSRTYNSNHLIVTMGNDFNYQGAESWFENLDKLIRYVNEKDEKFYLFYSTPGCYLYALNQAKSLVNDTRQPSNTPPLKSLTSDINDQTLGETYINKIDHETFTLEGNGPRTEDELGDKVKRIFNKQISPKKKKARYHSIERQTSPLKWPVKQGGDFFPLVNFGINFWTGYFTSRPTFKGMIRYGSAYLQICRQIEALSGNNRSSATLQMLERALGLAQHHDAVTGTAKQAVTYDYMFRLHKGILACEESIKQGLTKLKVLRRGDDLQFCHTLNISVCNFTQSNNRTQFSVILYNPLGWQVSHVVQIPVSHRAKYHVYDQNGKMLPYQMESIFKSVLRIPERYHVGISKSVLKRNSKTDSILSFKTTIPPIGISNYIIKMEKHSLNDVNTMLTKSSNAIKRREWTFNNIQNSKSIAEVRETSIKRYTYRGGKYKNQLNVHLPAIRTEFSKGKIDNSVIQNVKTVLASNDILSSQIDPPSTNNMGGEDELFIENQRLKLIFDPATRHVKCLVNKISKISTNIDVNFYWYGAPLSTASFTSGAYLFRSNAHEANNISQWSRDDRLPKLKLIKGKIYQQAQIEFADWLYVELTLYQDVNADYLELTWTVGSIPINDSTPKDIVLRFESDIQSMIQKFDDDIDDPNTNFSDNLTNFNKFYTDSNGRFMVPRYVNMHAYQESITNRELNFIPMQYYPINTKIFIKDENGSIGDALSKRQLGIITDRAQGATSLNVGDIEIMVHRRTLNDDNLGVNEALNELGSDGSGLIARGKHFIVFDDAVKCNEIMTRLAQQVYARPQVMFSDFNEPKIQDVLIEPQNASVGKQFIEVQLTPNLHLLSLAPWDNSMTPKLLIRLEHIYSPGEHPNLSKPVIVNLKNLFKTLSIHGLKEMALGANQELSSVHRFEWSYSNNLENDSTLIYGSEKDAIDVEDDFIITLQPMEIRTFIADIEYLQT